MLSRALPRYSQPNGYSPDEAAEIFLFARSKNA
jgi:hypothetical protein